MTLLPKTYIAVLVAATAVLIISPDSSRAQAPLLEISNADSNVFQVFENGAVAIGSQPDLDSSYDEANKTRMVWYQELGALRAGKTRYYDLDPNEMGHYSTALGVKTVAAADGSLTIGRFNDANSDAINTEIGSDTPLFVAGNGNPLGNNYIENEIRRSSDALVLTYGGNLKISGTLTESSDRRLKTNIEPLNDGVLEKLGQIRPVRFNFKEGLGHPEERQIGLIAQEVQKQFPELVGDGIEGYLSLSYSKFTAVLLKGLQEQQAEIERLQAKMQRIGALEARLVALEDQRAPGAVTAGLPTAGWLLGVLLIIGLGALYRRRTAG